MFTAFSAHAESVPATPSPPSVETVAAKASLTMCIASTVKQKTPEDLAREFKFPELPPEKAALFSKQGAAVFAIPPHIGQLVLVTGPVPICQVAVRTLSPPSLWAELEKVYGPESPFKLLKTETDAPEKGSETRTYEGDIDGKSYSLIVTVGNAPRENAAQGLITISPIR